VCEVELMHGRYFSHAPHDSLKGDVKVVSRENNKKVYNIIQGKECTVPDDQILGFRTGHQSSMPEILR
jgi:hypothetical protein